LVVRTPEIIIEDLNRLNSRVSGGSRRAALKSDSELDARWAAGTASAGVDLFGEPLTRRDNDQASRIFPSNGQYLPGYADAENKELVKLDQARKAAETDVIMKALYSTQWNRKRAAALLGIDYKALLYKMKKLGID
jgi:DNA-binding NtrC family response regulator